MTTPTAGGPSTIAAPPSSTPPPRARTRTRGDAASALPIPDRFSEGEEPPLVTLTGGSTGAVEVTDGRARLRFVESEGTVVAEAADPPPPTAGKPLVIVRRRPDGAPPRHRRRGPRARPRARRDRARLSRAHRPGPQPWRTGEGKIPGGPAQRASNPPWPLRSRTSLPRRRHAQYRIAAAARASAERESHWPPHAAEVHARRPGPQPWRTSQ